MSCVFSHTLHYGYAKLQSTECEIQLTAYSLLCTLNCLKKQMIWFDIDLIITEYCTHRKGGLMPWVAYCALVILKNILQNIVLSYICIRIQHINLTVMVTNGNLLIKYSPRWNLIPRGNTQRINTINDKTLQGNAPQCSINMCHMRVSQLSKMHY